MKTNKPVRPIVATLMLILSQLACQTLFPGPATVTATVQVVPPTVVIPTQTITPTGSPEFSDDQISAGIQESLDLYAEALTNNRPELLEQVVDQENKPFRRIVRSRFDDSKVRI